MTTLIEAKTEHPFYGVEVYADREQAHIQKLLEKYLHEAADEDLKKKIWDELQQEKYQGRINIPFKVVLRRDQTGKFPSYIEVILDTKL